MAQTEIDAPKETVERYILLTGRIMQFLLDSPQIFDCLPDKFELVILPDDDPEIRQYNLELLDKYGREDRPRRICSYLNAVRRVRLLQQSENFCSGFNRGVIHRGTKRGGSPFRHGTQSEISMAPSPRIDFYRLVQPLLSSISPLPSRRSNNPP